MHFMHMLQRYYKNNTKQSFVNYIKRGLAKVINTLIRPYCGEHKKAILNMPVKALFRTAVN